MTEQRTFGRRARRDKGREPIRREALQDMTVSFKARGILGYLLSLPDDWQTDSIRMARAAQRDGRDAIRTGLDELEAAGYLFRTRVRFVASGQVGWVWLYADDPAELVETAAAELDALGAVPIRGPEKGVTAVRSAVRPDRTGAGTFAQVRPTTDFPASGDPAPDGPTSGDPTSGDPASYRETPQIPLTPSAGPGENASDQESTKPPRPPAAAGGEASAGCEHGKATCRACGTSPRAAAAAAASSAASAARADERRERERTAVARHDAIAACELCDDLGYRGHRLCHHRPELLDAGAEARAEIRAHLASKSGRTAAS